MSGLKRLFRSKWERCIGETESPIEGLFLEALCMTAIEHGYEVYPRMKAAPVACSVIIEPQRWIDQYRVDFLVSYTFFGELLEIVVECDGHEFHERTKEQAKRDRQRDRSLQSLGMEVFRFTGSELVASPNLCAAEVVDEIESFQTRCFSSALSRAQVRGAA